MNQKISRVGILGGVHGNELTGVYLLKKWQQDKKIQRDTFRTILIEGNPRAIEFKSRYIDADLNRSFSEKNLSSEEKTHYEAVLARSIYKKYGPSGSDPLDFLIDLHTTTANMASTIVLLNEDPYSLQVAAFVKRSLPGVKLFRWTSDTFEPEFINSLADKNFTIEMGPIATNTLRADTLNSTESLVGKVLDFIEAANLDSPPELPATVEVFQYVGTMDYPKDSEGQLTAIIHPELQDQDYKKIAKGSPIFQTFSGQTIQYEGTEEIWPVFINEAAYYEKGVAFILSKKISVPIG